MKIIVIGGTGLIGSKTVSILRQSGHEVVAASPNGGVNTIAGTRGNGRASPKSVMRIATGHPRGLSLAALIPCGQCRRGSNPSDYSHGESHLPESVSLMLEGYGRWP